VLCLAGVLLLTLAGCGKREEGGRPDAPPVSTEPGPGMRQHGGDQSGAQRQSVPQGPNTEESPTNLRGYEEPKYQDPFED